MEYYVPCPCGGKESPCFACCETGMIGPLSLYEYNSYYADLKNQINGMVKSHPSNGKGKEMKLCGICEKPTTNGEYCNQCEERRERMRKGIKDKLNEKGKGKWITN